jgi:hypothetical protein
MLRERLPGADIARAGNFAIHKLLLVSVKLALGRAPPNDDLELVEICHRWHGQGIVREKGLLAAAAVAQCALAAHILDA